MTLTDELRRRLPHRSYLVDWFRHRESLSPWPEEGQDLWVPRTAQAVERWSNRRDQQGSPLDRQEQAKLQSLSSGDLPLAEAVAYVLALYPEQAQSWSRAVSDDPEHRRALANRWQAWRETRQTLHRQRQDAAELPSFHSSLWQRIRKLAEAETAVRSLLTDRDLGWDLESGVWDHLDLTSLYDTAAMLQKEPALSRIAELLGRDYRAKSRPPETPPIVPPDPNADPEPGRTEIRGVRHGYDWATMVSSEAALLGFSDTQTLFFKKAAESELLIWDSFTPAPPPDKDDRRTAERQKRNDRGPIVIALDTSGSMRGQPEQVAKGAVLALLRVALEESRACYLINFSVQQRFLDLSRLETNLPDLLSFLQFSFHGGTDLPPALRECIRVLETGSFRDADVLVVSDFAVPKIPAGVRSAIRQQQESRGTRFYSLTVSVRPLNDFLNIFDGGWVYNIHPFQTNGIAPESLEALG